MAVICSSCHDIHVGKGLGVHDGGVSFGLGDCRSGGLHKWGMARLIGPAPIIGFGRYTLKEVSLEAALEWVKSAPVWSAICFPPVAMVLELILDRPMPYDKKARFVLDAGDEALVPIIDGKGKLDAEYIRTQGLKGIDWKLGIMKRID